MLEELEIFMQEFRTWSWQLDNLLVTGAVARFSEHDMSTRRRAQSGGRHHTR